MGEVDHEVVEGARSDASHEAAPSTACGGPPPPQAGEDLEADY